MIQYFHVIKFILDNYLALYDDGDHQQRFLGEPVPNPVDAGHDPCHIFHQTVPGLANIYIQKEQSAKTVSITSWTLADGQYNWGES